ncbi:MAG: cytochrome b [Hyphomicrobiaceae bacterium]
MESHSGGRPPEAHEGLVYSPTARAFHWLTVAFVALQVPLGLYMVWRGATTNFDAATNTLYSVHKLVGFILLWLVVARLLYRFAHGAPPDEPTLEWWQKAAAHATHWGLYALLIVVPVLGWLGVSYYGALGTLFGINLPAIAAQNQDKAELVFKLHFWAALLIVAGVGAHVGAAFFHHFIRGDGVLRRMLPGLRPRG